ncbi:MAG TPA: anthranilate phosphoribosyltransferase [Longimicrobiales bacterium]
MPPNPIDAGSPDLGDLIARVASGQTLSADEAEAAFAAMMAGAATPVQMAAFLVALRVRGETPAEIAGGVRALRRAMIPVPAADGEPLLDTCGTGGGRVTTFNISTAAAFVVAGAGVRVAKHGNRSFTSRSGSADVLEALGVAIELSPAAMAAVLEEAGIVFMFAPLLHPAMRHVAPVRRELGIPTIMNLLGPLTNPAHARRQVVGVADPERLDIVAGALRELGHDRALVVHGAPGLDELSPLGPSDVVELRDGALRRYRVDPTERFGWGALDPGELAGGEPAHNARIIEDVLAGRRGGAARAAIVLNAGAALYVAGRVDSIEDGAAEAERIIDAGAGYDALRRLRDASRRAAETKDGKGNG